jgi:hypothetical protein
MARGIAKECRDGCIGIGEMCWCRVTIVSAKLPPAAKPQAEQAEEAIERAWLEVSHAGQVSQPGPYLRPRLHRRRHASGYPAC